MMPTLPFGLTAEQLCPVVACVAGTPVTACQLNAHRSAALHRWRQEMLDGHPEFGPLLLGLLEGLYAGTL